MSVKESLTTRVRREVSREGNFQIINTIIFCLTMAFCVVILAVFINDHVKKFIVSEDLYSPHVNVISPPCPTSSVTSHCLCSSSSSSSSFHSYPLSIIRSNGLNDLISPKVLWHTMTDDELTWRATMVPRVVLYPYDRTPKVAFMFLTRGKLPLGPLWEMFFKGHESFFSIYLHTSPEFNFEPQKSSVFYNRRIPSQAVQWGMSTMINAERRLLSNALLDFSNQRFILLSETCIPLFNFTTIYNYLINSNHSFLSSFDDPRHIGRGRYNHRMSPTITLSDWRKGSQWFEVDRKLAIEIVSDVTYYPVFRNHCLPPCYMDEHYLPTLVNKLCPEMTSNRSITWTDWSQGGSHPTLFVRKDVSMEFLNSVRFGFNCTYNGGMTSICFLFARKFHPSTLQPLLQIAPILLGSYDNHSVGTLSWIQ